MSELHLEEGVVTSVEEVLAGDALAAPLSTTDLVLYLYDACDFDEDGGRALLSGEDGSSVELVYLAADLDADILTLAAPPSAGWPLDTVVHVSPSVLERRARVQLDVDGDGVEARIPHALYERLPLGTRDAGERVTLDRDGSEWVVSDVLGRVPLIDGTFIDPETLPPAPASDGVPPEESPTPTVIGGIGALYARWSAPDNADPLTYHVHVSAASGFTPDASTLVVETPATSITIRKLPTAVGTPPSDALRYDVPYYVRLIASDVDGPGPLGGEASGTMVKITGPDIAANSVVAEHIVAGTITGRLLTSEVILGSKITTGSIDALGLITGQRVEMDPAGLRVVTSDGTPIVSLPTDPGQAARFEGSFIAKEMNVTGGAVFSSVNNTIAPASGLTMAYVAGEPVISPTIATDYASVTLAQTVQSGPLGTFALDPSNVVCISPSPTPGIIWVAQFGSPGGPVGTRVWRYSLATGENVADATGFVEDYPGYRFHGITMIGTRWVALFRNIASNGFFLLDRSQPQVTQYYLPRGKGDGDIALGNDGTNLITVEITSTAGIEANLLVTFGAWDNTGVGVYTPNAVVTSTVKFASGIFNMFYGLRYAGRGTFGLPGNRLVVGANGVTGQFGVYPVTAGAAPEAAYGWPAGASDLTGGMYLGGVFYGLGSDGVLRQYTNSYVATGVKVWAALTWRDTNGAPHETMIGPASSMAPVSRARLKVTVQPVPGGTGVDVPNAYGLYMQQRSTFSAAAWALQASVTPTPGASSSVILASVAALGGANPAPPIRNDFPSSAAGYIQSQATRQDGNSKFYADGSGRANVDGMLPPGTIVMTAATAPPVIPLPPLPPVPPGWLLCDGTAVPRDQFGDLFAAIGTTYGAGDGATTFNLPNLKGNVPVGRDPAQPEFDTLGESGGAKTHTLTTGQMPAHSHPLVDAAVPWAAHEHHLSDLGGAAFAIASTTSFRVRNVPSPGGDSYISTHQYAANQTTTNVAHAASIGLLGNTDKNTEEKTITMSNTGGGGAHNNLQPYISLNFIIKT